MTPIIHNEDTIQYVMDSQGKRIAVLIPIDLWNQWRREVKPNRSQHSLSPKKYRGILKGKGFVEGIRKRRCVMNGIEE